MKRLGYGLLLLLVGLMIACSSKNESREEQSGGFNKDELAAANKYLIKKDAEVIKSFIERRDWDMKETETGLWYMVYETGHGRKAGKGDLVTFHYKVRLLDGTELYNSQNLGPKQVKLGHQQMETGLEQGLMKLQEGDKARLIIPPHLGHGLIGDQNKIPPRSVILYDIELIEVKNI